MESRSQTFEIIGNSTLVTASIFESIFKLKSKSSSAKGNIRVSNETRFELIDSTNYRINVKLLLLAHEEDKSPEDENAHLFTFDVKMVAHYKLSSPVEVDESDREELFREISLQLGNKNLFPILRQHVHYMLDGADVHGVVLPYTFN